MEGRCIYILADLLSAGRKPIGICRFRADLADVLDDLLVALLYSHHHLSAHGEHDDSGGTAVDASAERDKVSSSTGAAKVIP